MDDALILSTDSDNDDSDVEYIGSYCNVVTKADPLPLTAVRVDADVLNVPKLYIDLSNPRWTLTELKLPKKQNSTALTVIDLTETDVVNVTNHELESLPPDDSHMKKESTVKTSNKQDCDLQKSSVFVLQQDCGNLSPKQRCLESQTQQQMQTDKAHHPAAIVKLRRSPFLETHVAELKTSRCSVYLNKDCTQMSLRLRQLDSEVLESNLRNSTASNCPHMDPSPDESPPQVTEPLIRLTEQENSNEITSTQLNAEVSLDLQSPAHSPSSDKTGSLLTSKEHSPHEDKRDEFCSPMLNPSPTSPSSSHDKAQGFQREVHCSELEQPKLVESGQSYLSDHSLTLSPATGPNPPEPSDLVSNTAPVSHNLMSQVDPPPFEHTDKASNSADFLHWSTPGQSPLSMSNENMEDGSWARTYRGGLDIDSPVSFLWQEGSDGDEENKESRFDKDFRAASREDRQFVCPVALRKMSGPFQALFDEEDGGFAPPEVLCPQSLSLVYSTMEENHPEGTLQLLSDLLQPGYYPPRDITSHLLRGILLDPQCPSHLCVQAFHLLMRTQRHNMANKTTVPWDWELLSSVMANQGRTRRHSCEVVRMLLDYVVQTLEDDFKAKHSALHLSIVKATLSCDQQFPHVREVIKWLFSAIVKSTEHGGSREAARQRDEQIRMVSIFQRMLSLALEVDRSPALNSAKLSQELFHMLINDVPLRAHRMLLLESLQSKLLTCKLLEHLLDYACPLKVPLPMSLNLLLHFLKYCTLAPDPSDGTERWQRWEELVHLLWMLLLSYNKAMKGYLCNSFSEQRGNMIYKPDDMVSKPAICEAVEAFLSRSRADLGQALPLHVEESLSYLQDYLLDVCQC